MNNEIIYENTCRRMLKALIVLQTLESELKQVHKAPQQRPQDDQLKNAMKATDKASWTNFLHL